MRIRQQRQPQPLLLELQQQREQDDNQSVALEDAFSPEQPAGASVASCPYSHHVPTKPCNLKLLQLKETSSDEDGSKTRVVEVHKEISTPIRNASPVKIPSGGTFQITAPSQAHNSEKPRQVQFSVTTEAVCSSKIHPLIDTADASGEVIRVKKNRKLGFFRDAMLVDTVPLGFFAIVNSIFQGGSSSYSVGSLACGMPVTPGGASIDSLSATVEVFPADQFSLTLKIPAFLKPDSLDYSKASKQWTSERAKQEKEIEEAGKEGESAYESEPRFREVGGIKKAEFRKFAEDQKKRKLGYIEGNPDGLSVELTQTDGERKISPPLDDIIKLIKCIVKAEYAFKEFNKWLDSFQVGPGVSFKAECQFFIVSLNATWGYKEYTDDRCFRAINGSLTMTLIKAGLDINLGFKFAGAADLFLFLKGDGQIDIGLSVNKESPDDHHHAKPKVSGDLTIEGGLHGAAGWSVLVIEGKVEVTFKADVEQMQVLSEKGIFSGTVKVSREPVNAVLTVSSCFWGTTTDETELIKKDDNLAEFDLGS